MRAALKRLGWAVGVAAGASLCFALHRRRGSPTQFGSLHLLPPPSGAAPARPRPNLEPLLEFPRNANIVSRHSTSPELALEAKNRPEDNGFPPVCFDMMDSQLPRPPGLLRSRMVYWILTLSLLAIALTCAYYSVASGRRPVSPGGSDFDSMRVAMPQQVPREDQRPWVGLLLTMPDPLTSMGGGFAVRLHNSGTSPAFEVRIHDIIHIEESSEKPAFPVIDDAPALAEGTLLPGAEVGTHVAFRTSPATIAALRDGGARVVNYLLVTYEDSSHQPHRTQQCFSWSPGRQSPTPCDTDNRAE